MNVTEIGRAHSFLGGRVPTELVHRAQSRIDQRRAREDHLPGAIFGEPAWEILLQLFVNDAYGPSPISKLAELVGTPPTAVLRWVAYLESKSLVKTRDDPLDARKRMLVLTRKGIESLSHILGD